jgi:hypothetical protein
MNNVFDVRMFGAKGDGVTNDTAAIVLAIAALPTSGGTVYFPPGTYLVTSTLSFGDKDIEFHFTPGAKIITTGLGANPLFKSLTGLTEFRKAIFWNPKCVGEDSAAAQYFLELADVNSRCRLEVYSPDITQFRRVFNISGADLAYIVPVSVRVIGGQIIPPNAVSTLIKSPGAAGTYDAGRSVYFSECLLLNEDNNNLGWTLDFDGDVFLSDVSILVTGTSKVDGLTCVNAYIQGPAGSQLEILGQNYYGSDMISARLYSIILKISSQYAKAVGCLLSDVARIIINGSRVNVVGLVQSSQGTIPAIAVDILAGADYALVDGSFQDCVTAGIRTAATKGSFRGTFAPTGVHKAIIELAGADFNIASGCSGLGAAAANVTQVGANSHYDVTLANTA